MRKGQLLWQGKLPASELVLKKGPDFLDHFDLADLLNEVDLLWGEIQKKHPRSYNGILLYCSDFSLGRFSIGAMEFKVQTYLLKKGISLPKFQGNLGFKLHLYDMNNRLLVGRRSLQSIHLPGYISTIGGMFEQSDTNLVDAIKREFQEECTLPIASVNWTELNLIGIVKEENMVCIDLVFEANISNTVPEKIAGNEEWEEGLWWAENGSDDVEKLLEDILLLAWRRNT